MKRTIVLAVVVSSLLLSMLPVVLASAPPTGSGISSTDDWTLELASRTDSDLQAGSDCVPVSVSADGRYVLFLSYDNTLTDEFIYNQQAFLRDTVDGTTTLVSRDAEGNAMGPGVLSACLSDDGAYVVFVTDAGLLPADPVASGMDQMDVYRRELATGKLELVSVNAFGTAAAGCHRNIDVSADGSRVTYSTTNSSMGITDSNGLYDVFVRDMDAAQTFACSVNLLTGAAGNLKSDSPKISGDGAYVVYVSEASDVFANDLNGAVDYVRCTVDTGLCEPASVASDGSQHIDSGMVAVRYCDINGDGSRVVFVLNSENLVAGDDNSRSDVFLHDFGSGKTVAVSATADGTISTWGGSEASISSNGRYVAFRSYGCLLPEYELGWNTSASQVYLCDMATHELRLISQVDGTPGNGGFGWPGSDHSILSANGNAVAFRTYSTNLVVPDANGSGVRDVLLASGPVAPEQSVCFVPLISR